LDQFKKVLSKELKENIIPFWMKQTLDKSHGGFIGRITHDLILEPKAPKGLILNARILWTFSALYRYFGNSEYLSMAQSAFEYVTQKFYDTKFGGYYWMLSYCGEPVDVKKKIYGQAFVVYALSEYGMAIGNQRVIDLAKDLFQILESKCHDTTYGGYFESYNRDWTLAKDLRLSEKDMDEKKSMNAHLHMLESYTNLYRAWKSEKLRAALQSLIEIFQIHILDPRLDCFRLFFDEKWDSKTDRISFGHDIEGSWLMSEASHVLGDPQLIQLIKARSVRMVKAVQTHGLDPDGGLLYEGSPNGPVDTNKHWWPQAEAVVGFINGYQISGEKQYLDMAYQCWKFIEKNIVDRKNGEWLWKVTRDCNPVTSEYKVSEWKGPYHNTRACLEILNRLDSISSKLH
jgi:mannobiose 2-epimerase